MARTKVGAAAKTQTQAPIPGGAPGIPELDPTSPPLVNEAPVVADATEDSDREARAKLVPKPKRYRITVGGMVLQAGHRTPMKAGKIIDELNYNLAQLTNQGIRFEEIP